MWDWAKEWIKKEFLNWRAARERFFHWSVVRAMFLIWFGYTMQHAGRYEVEMVIPYFSKYVGWWSIIEGISLSFNNPIKEKIIFNQLVEKRKKVVAAAAEPQTDLKML